MAESQNPTSWLDKAKAEANTNPVERGIKEMLAQIEHIDSPEQLIDVKTVPEFDLNAARDGHVLFTTQGTLISSEHTPLRSDNAATCQYLLMRTPLEKPGHRYSLVHTWDGDIDLNLPGAKINDIAAITNTQTDAIQIIHDRNPNYIATARQLKYRGITTTKAIEIHNGKEYIHVVFRPDENKILIRIGESETVQVFEGFSQAPGNETQPERQP